MKTCKITILIVLLLVLNSGTIRVAPLFIPPSRIELFASKELLVRDVQKYIDITCGVEEHISAREFIRCSYKYDVDINLMLSQAKLESHFGTKGRATRTNSVFGVGAWDTGENKNYYSSPDESIESYTKYIKDRYLSNGRTVDDLLNNGFVCIYGYRYASDVSYEPKIKNEMKKIDKNTTISQRMNYLQEFCKNNNIDITKIF